MLLKPSSLNLRLFIITTFGVLGTMTVVLFFSYHSFEQMMTARFEEKIQFLSRHLASSAILALAFKDQRALLRLAEGVLKEDEVTGVVIEDAQGRMLVKLGTPSPKDRRVEKEVVSRVPEEGLIFGTTTQKLQPLGKVIIYFSTEEFKKRMKHLLFQSVGVGLILALVIDFFLYFLVSRAVTTPLKALLEGVRRIKAGELRFDPPQVSLTEVRELAQAFAEMVDSLKKSREALARSYEEMLRNKTLAEVGRFSLMIAHEIKNPLGIIKGALDLLRKEEMNPEIKSQMLSYIEEEIHRIDTLIQSFLTFARPKKLNFEELDLCELLEMVVKRAAVEYGEGKVHFSCTGPLPFKGDSFWLEQSFFNLIKNAFEAGGKNVWVEVAKKDQRLIVKVWDDGPGIPEEKRQEIFKPFYTDKTKGGTGLGLPIAEQIITLHGGKIEVEEAPTGGALFRITFPYE